MTIPICIKIQSCSFIVDPLAQQNNMPLVILTALSKVIKGTMPHRKPLTEVPRRFSLSSIYKL
jgi:hypothetical protein